MPEGDTVWLAAHRLHEALAGRTLVRCDLRVPRLATTDLSGRRVEEVVPRGKHLLTRIEGGWTLHSHLRMDGSWQVYGAAERWRGGPMHQVRAVLGTAERVAVGYRLPVLELLPTAEEESVVGHLGPDLLGPGWDAAEAVRRLLADPARRSVFTNRDHPQQYLRHLFDQPSAARPASLSSIVDPEWRRGHQRRSILIFLARFDVAF